MNLLNHTNKPYQSDKVINSGYLQPWLHQLLCKMLYLEALDKKASILQKTGYMHTYPCAFGHEAISIALGEILTQDDVFTPYYRDHGTLLDRGATGIDILNYWSGRASMPITGTKDLPMAIPIATQCSHAAGIAYAIKLEKSDKVVVCSLGDGATSKGDFYEALNFSVIHKLPVIFLISNNQWAISTPIHKQSATTNLADKSLAFNCMSSRIDGTDILALIEGFSSAVDLCRNNPQPILLEAITYRLGDHTTVDDASRYIPADDLLAAKKNSPIKKFINKLEINNQLTIKELNNFKVDIKTRIDQLAVEFINMNQTTELNSIVEHVYQDVTPNLHKQLLDKVSYEAI